MHGLLVIILLVVFILIVIVRRRRSWLLPLGRRCRRLGLCRLCGRRFFLVVLVIVLVLVIIGRRRSGLLPLGRLGGRGFVLILVFVFVFVFVLVVRRGRNGLLALGRLCRLLVVIIRLTRDGDPIDHRLDFGRALDHVRRDPEQVAVATLGHRSRERLTKRLWHLEWRFQR